MDAIRDLIEYVANDIGGLAATLFPFALLGLIGLYLLWLVIGYLRVSQVGINAESAVLPTLQLPKAPDGAIEAARGVVYCPNDGIAYPAGAVYCTVCESDLVASCANCGASIRAADESCYRCGTRDTLIAAAR
ncbi:MAG: zinc ribbon domain-containing protein [Chloroflexota bacterium]